MNQFSFDPTLLKKALTLVSHGRAPLDLNSSQLTMDDRAGFACLQYALDRRYLDGRPLYSTGNTQGVVAIQAAKLTLVGRQVVDGSPSLYLVTAERAGGSIAFFEHRGSPFELAPNDTALVCAVEELLVERPHLVHLRIDNQLLGRVGFVHFEELGHVEPNFFARGRKGYFGFL